MVISRIKKSIFIKVFWGLMGIYLLNISVDSPDPYPGYIQENLTFNDQESIVEIIIEKILGFENAIEEYDDYDAEDHDKKNNVKIDLIVQYIIDSNKYPSAFGIRKKRHPDVEAYLTNSFYQLDPPPPKTRFVL